jgi:hypothetical protein
MDNEKFYDEEIAPLLLEVGKKCKERGLSFTAAVEYAPNQVAGTSIISEGAGIEIQLVHQAVKAQGNVDALFMAIQRYAKVHGHNSVYLAMLERLSTI